MSLKAIVEGGRLRLDQPTSLPDGTVVDLFLDDDDEALSPNEVEALNAALTRAANDLDAGRSVDAEDLLARLDSKRR